jgi:pimeloyl-ACP methyl ester carboxylesterase
MPGTGPPCGGAERVIAMRRTGVIVALSALLGMSVGGVTAAPALAGGAVAGVRALAGSASPQAVGSFRWRRCADPSLRQVHAQCALLPVPLDYRNPAGPQIKIAVSRIRHTSHNYQGVLVTNIGGPGVSGLGFPAYLIGQFKAEHLDAAASGYDWIGFDPRGVGSSVPAITCDPNYFSPDRRSYTPRTRPVLRYWKARTADYAADCTKHGAAQTALLRHITTADTARDIDAIRRALGAAQITYFAPSYGTYLGQVYATLFPTHVRRMVLDSSVDPRRVWYQATLSQDIPSNRNAKIWFRWIAKNHRVYRLGRTERAVQRRWYAEKARLAGHPALGKVGPDEWTDIFVFAAIFQPFWPDLGSAFADWAHGHGTAAGKNLVALYRAVDGPGNDNFFAAFSAVQCTDAPWPHHWARWNRDARRLNRAAPFFTWYNAWFTAPCLYWKAPAHTPVTVNGTRIKSALLIDETLDASTPFSGSLEVRRLFPHAVLIAVPGGPSHGHALSGNMCVDRTIARYLQHGTLPPRKPHARWDKTCQPLPPPTPGTSAPAKLPASTSRPPLSHGLSAWTSSIRVPLSKAATVRYVFVVTGPGNQEVDHHADLTKSGYPRTSRGGDRHEARWSDRGARRAPGHGRTGGSLPGPGPARQMAGLPDSVH